MAIHELTTNSLKYGALRDEAGKLDVTWARTGRTGFSFDWSERVSGTVTPPSRTGFGSMILDSIVPNQLGAVLGDPDPERAARVLEAMLQMRKLDLDVMRAAADGSPA